jgi:hypothetical protein
MLMYLLNYCINNTDVIVVAMKILSSRLIVG